MKTKTSKTQKDILKIEKEIALHISANSIKDNEQEVLDVAILSSLLMFGLKKTIEMFGNRRFIKNLIKNEAMNKEGIFYVSDEDVEYEYIWFLMTLLVGRGLVKRV